MTVDAYGLRMARVNLTLPDDLVTQARAAGINISGLAALALAEELERRDKIAALGAYLAELDATLGPVPPDELAAAEAWADAAFGPATRRAG